MHDFSDMLFTPRYAVSLDLSDTQTLLAGASAAFGPNSSGSDEDTQIYGVDLFWKWKSPNADAGFPFVTWQTEAMLRRYEAGAFTEVLPDTDLNDDGIADSIPAETLTDWGFYSQVLWGFRKGWVAGLRGDYVAPVARPITRPSTGRTPNAAVALAHLAQPDLVSHRVLQDPAAIQLRRPATTSAWTIRSGCNSNSCWARTPRTSSRTQLSN